MSVTKHIKISDFNYDLPEERIAKFPLKIRDQSKLLLYNHGVIDESKFCNLAEYIPEGTLLIRNNTRVIQARLHFHKATGALIEVFCLEPDEPADYAMNFQQTEHVAWQCMIGNQRKWKGEILNRQMIVKGKKITLSAEKGDTLGTSTRVDFRWDNSKVTFADILEVFGVLPIPPYLKRETQESDKTTYQTIYSKIKGSVAAPTAGLHFTPQVFDSLLKKNIEIEELTLHVGAGTFKPVTAKEIQGHEMHTEYISISRHTLERLIAYKGECFAVGTTSVRTLESLYYIGVTLGKNPDATEEEMHVKQWQPYDQPSDMPTLDSLNNIITYMNKYSLEALHTSTQVIIAPGYNYHIVKGMITNFHQPQSTLLLLVSAFIGDDWRKIYDYALKHGFRFLSYGDSSLLIP